MGRSHEKRHRRARHLQPRCHSADDAGAAPRIFAQEAGKKERRYWADRHKSMRGDPLAIPRILQFIRSHRALAGHRKDTLAKDKTRDTSRHLSVHSDEVQLYLGELEEELRGRTTSRRIHYRAVGLSRCQKRENTKEDARHFRKNESEVLKTIRH